MKKSICITENRLREIISESIKNTLNEIGYRGATLAAGANMRANAELSNGKLYYGKRRRSNITKMDKSAKINYPAITKSVEDTLGYVSLLFKRQEEEGYLNSIVRFLFNEVIFLSNDCFIVQGITEMSKHPIPSSKYTPKPIYVQVEYDFRDGQFYEVVYCANGTIRKLHSLTLIDAEDVGEENKQNAEALIQHMTLCLYSIEDYKSGI